jgi:hypothetical protein
MAKVDHTFSTFDGIWLCDALELATVRLGSKALAKERLREWLGGGNLPWSCMGWKGLDAEGLAKRRREKKRIWTMSAVVLSVPSAAYYPGDPRFWRARLVIDWEDNEAHEARRDGAQALGIRVSRTHLLALLPEEPRESVKVPSASQWITAEARRMKAANEIPPDIRITAFARELERRMQKAAAIDSSLRRIKWRSIMNRLREWGLWPITSIK